MYDNKVYKLVDVVNKKGLQLICAVDSSTPSPTGTQVLEQRD